MRGTGLTATRRGTGDGSFWLSPVHGLGPADAPPEAPAPDRSPPLDRRAILTTVNLDGDTWDGAVRQLLAAGADANASSAPVFAARHCAPGAEAMLLDAGADPHVCLERRGSCLREGALDAVVYGRFPYVTVADKLEAMDADDPECAACQATADLLRPVTRVY